MRNAQFAIAPDSSVAVRLYPPRKVDTVGTRLAVSADLTVKSFYPKPVGKAIECLQFKVK